MLDIITTCNNEGFQLYGKKMVETFDRFWPQDIRLHIYLEDTPLNLKVSKRIISHDLHTEIPSLVIFKNRHKNNPETNGSRMKTGGINFDSNHFRWDAVKFSNKVYVVTTAALQLQSDYMAWLDADTLTFETPSIDLIQRVLPNKDQYCSYLGRHEKYHSECGWVGYNLKHPANEKFMSYWKYLYDSDKLLKLKEYHDSYVFDIVRKKFEAEHGIKNKNLTPPHKGKGPGHPFIASELGSFMDHLKGKRKNHGHSGGKDALNNQNLEYWRKLL